MHMKASTKKIITESKKGSKDKISLHTQKQNLSNKKIYFDSDGTEIKIWYDEETGTGFVEIISE